MTTRPLIFDSDGGVDDAQALLMLIANGKAPTLITSVFGNVGLDAATRNLLTVLAVAGSDIPVHAGADRPMTQPIIDARHVHGEDGLGGAPRPEQIGTVASNDGIGVLRSTFREAVAHGERVDIIMIGPLTNLAMALRLEPAIIDGIGRLTIMGGTVYGRGNTTPAAEFNIYADPEAASVVFAADIDTIVAPWEACASHRIAGDTVDAIYTGIHPSPVREFSKALVDHARRINKGYIGVDAFRFVDPLAAALIIDPSIVRKSIDGSVAVALAPGLTRGMTVVDPSGRLGTRKHTFVEEVDLDRMTAFYAASAAYVPTRNH